MHSYGSLHMAEQKQSIQWTYLQQVCEDSGCSPENLPKAMNDREGWWERFRDIRADGTKRRWDEWLFIVKEEIKHNP